MDLYWLQRLLRAMETDLLGNSLYALSLITDKVFF